VAIEVNAAILKIRTELSGDALEKVDSLIKKLGLAVVKMGKDGSESLQKIDTTLSKTGHTLRNMDMPFSNFEKTVGKVNMTLDNLIQKKEQTAESCAGIKPYRHPHFRRR
jgi:hypothetical protein